MMHQPVHFALDVHDRLATLQLNRQNRRGNSFDLDLLTELELVLGSVARIEAIDTLLIRGKWNFDLDLESLLSGDAPMSARNLTVRGQQLLQQLDKVGERIQTVAWIEGECRGIGLEIALACRMRIGLQQPENSLHFDFAEKSLLPSWGAVQRLVSRLGASRARMLLTHSPILSLVEAEHWGLIDHLFPIDTADSLVQNWIDDARWKTGESPLFRFWKKLGSRTSLRGRGDSIPAEEGYLQLMHEVIAASRISSCEGLAAERNAFLTLSESKPAQHAMRLRQVADRPARPRIAPPGTVGIVGDTNEAIQLALFFAQREIEVLFHPGSEARDPQLGTRLQEAMRPLLRRGFCSEVGSEAILQRVRIVDRWEAFSDVSWLLEATRKDEFDLAEIWSHLGEILPREAILSPVNAPVSLSDLQPGFPRPERILGIECVGFFHSGRVIELSSGSETDDSMVSLVADWFAGWGQTVLALPTGSPSIQRRMLSVYFSEAIHLVAEGMPPEQIDREMRRRGMARGPLESLDRVGFDEVASWVDVLEPNVEIANLRLERMRSLGWNGKASGEGFYRYRKGTKWENEIARMVLWRSQEDDCTQHYVFDAEEAIATGIDRLLLRVVNEAGRILEEGVSVDQLDLASAWGLRLLPHQGGILAYADACGLSVIEDRLLEFCDRYGKRFEPCEELQRRVEASEKFATEKPFTVTRRVRRAG